ncbi:hypothetical protein PMZ82_17020 [[Clostridium] symbiosum]|uniref:hypothetical protein n=1 Tax=Clostridium symbiosum TaxID=1512 RepID=UPI00232C3C53|nr:hypothetical protein [[Clostridium] symbiosum]MDB1997391.1 hypothetical protein [[Clostridium] symbiosum]
MSININPIETYVPTIYVNNSEPDLDETNLNHAEQALKRVTDAANAAILALESLDSAKIDAAKIVNNLLATDTSTVLSGPMGKALGDRLTAAENLLTRLNSDLKIKFLDVTCQEGKTETTALSAYDNIVTGMASLSNNNYIIGHILINDRLIITSTVAHTVRVYYINIPKK